MLDFPYGIVFGVILVVGLSVGIGTLVVIVGFLVLAATLVLARGAATAYRFKQWAVLGDDIPGRPWPDAGPGATVWTRYWRFMGNGGLWLETLHGLVMMVLGPVWFTLVTLAWSTGLAAIAFPVYASWIPDGPAVDWGGFDPRSALGRVLVGVGGVLVLFLAAWIAELTARVDTAMARGLLGRSRTEQLRTQVDTLRTTRAAVVDAADEERRRIERDLHDGVQPQLVSLAMNLGMAQRKIDTDPAGARELVDQAHEEAKRAIVELRNVIRGVHPAVLAERGLDPALSALAARSPVPVTVDVYPEIRAARLPATVEAVAYFAVAEALTNVARHGQATEATVQVWGLPAGSPQPTQLLVRVSDNGVGGASAAPGSGLAGLHDRVAAVDGRMWLQSPPGGGTTLTLELPCAS